MSKSLRTIPSHALSKFLPINTRLWVGCSQVITSEAHNWLTISGPHNIISLPNIVSALPYTMLQGHYWIYQASCQSMKKRQGILQKLDSQEIKSAHATSYHFSGSDPHKQICCPLTNEIPLLGGVFHCSDLLKRFSN